MTTFDPSKPCVDLLPARKSSQRGAGIEWNCCTRHLTLTNSKTDRRYFVRELPIDRAEFHGRAFTLTKLAEGSDPEAGSYTLLVSDKGEGWDSCECKGWLRHSHCSHVDGIRTVISNGWMEDPAERPIDAEPTLEEVEDMGERAAPRTCCLCHLPMEAADAGKTGLAHADCEVEEWAALQAGYDAAAEFEAEPAWMQGAGCGPRADVPF